MPNQSLHTAGSSSRDVVRVSGSPCHALSVNNERKRHDKEPEPNPNIRVRTHGLSINEVYAASKPKSQKVAFASADIGVEYPGMPPVLPQDLETKSSMTTAAQGIVESTDMWSTNIPPSTGGGYVEDYLWTLGDQMEVLVTKKFTPKKKLNTSTSKPKTETNKASLIQPSTWHALASYTAKTVKPVTTTVQKRTLHIPITPDSCRTSSASPISTDTGSRAWSGKVDQRTTYSPATTPPLSPAAVTDAGKEHAWEKVAPGKGADRLFNSQLSGDEMPTISARRQSKIPSESISNTGRIITKRPIQELRALMLKKAAPKRKRALAAHPTVTKPKVVIVPAQPKVRAPEPPCLTSKQPALNPNRVKRAASPLQHSSYERPTKRPATQVNAVRNDGCKPVSPTTLIRWTSKLVTFEELVYSGKQGPGKEISCLMCLLKEMMESVNVTPAAWVLKTERTRTVDGETYYKNKLELLELVAEGYKNCDGGEMVQLAAELHMGWMGVAKQ
ncbi:hypothetical protein C8R43DRAFT_1242070 [Mycena crocata]|nr:hypothetical protein C8R43DRAFT_1242070 [Mycena crocata]